MERKRILSGMRASNERLHLGNFEGALRPWINLQNDYDMFCMVADWHSLTTLRQGEAFDVGRNTLEIAKDYVAAGLDPEKCAIFVQSHVPEHAELHLALSMVAGLGKLERVPTFKEKKDDLGSEQQVSYGLLGYPVLQAADILLYKPYGVPVGKDQAPHLEVSREIGRSFNHMFGVEVFPEFVNIIDQDELRSKLPGLDADENGVLRKMSKSYDNCIYLNDTADETAARIKGAFTTPSKLKKSDPGIPEGCAVCQYLKVYDPDYQVAWDEDRAGVRGCMQNKARATEVINEYLRPIRERRAALDDGAIREILAHGRDKARERASKTMDDVRAAMKLA
jgi:tryptophanyl-tRNA synthetase